MIIYVCVSVDVRVCVSLDVCVSVDVYLRCNIKCMTCEYSDVGFIGYHQTLKSMGTR